MRGEDVRAAVIVPAEKGSPPHAWGRLVMATHAILKSRFTPTCVGKTWLLHMMIPLLVVHPHMRGEDLTRPHSTRIHIGSPPHAWGRQKLGIYGILAARFTPTCVGKTSTLASGISFSSVHPHMRGEDVAALRVANGGNGSPPHAWGRRASFVIRCAVGRFTPTCVGKTGLLRRR